MTGRIQIFVLFATLFCFSPLQPGWGQTFLDRQDEDDFRVVSYNMFWDELFRDQSGIEELE